MRAVSASHGRPSVRPSFGHVYLKAGGVWLARSFSASPYFVSAVCLSDSLRLPSAAAESKGKFYEGMMSFESLDWSAFCTRSERTPCESQNIRFIQHSLLPAAVITRSLSPSLLASCTLGIGGGSRHGQFLKSCEIPKGLYINYIHTVFRNFDHLSTNSR